MGVIFDMDGVLIDSGAAHWESWRIVAEEDGVNFTEEAFWATFGMVSDAIVARHWGENPPTDPEEIAKIVDRKETAFRESVATHTTPIAGAVDFIRYLAERGVKMAVGSSAPRENVEHILRWLGVRELFGDRVVAGDEVKNGKPAPEIFLTAAKKLGVPAENCVVIDDARNGVNAGAASGAATVGFFSAGHSLDEYANAAVVVRSFDELREMLEIVEDGASVRLRLPR
ncbi:MAG: HAD family phosphatase [Thermoguttaceae bacterium]|nr:HAD family phosphatase [Thermoguttaceae bacterium]MBQ9801105.1 HAD family phosphatase [Thermoguttaceae bacterium]